MQDNRFMRREEEFEAVLKKAKRKSFWKGVKTGTIIAIGAASALLLLGHEPR